MVLKGIGQAEGFFFIDRINDARSANNNQPLMGLLILSALFFMLSGPIANDFDLPEFELPDLALTIEVAAEASEAMEEALAEEELPPMFMSWKEVPATRVSGANSRRSLGARTSRESWI